MLAITMVSGIGAWDAALAVHGPGGAGWHTVPGNHDKSKPGAKHNPPGGFHLVTTKPHGDQSDGDQSDGDQSDGDQSDGDQSDGDQSDGDQSDGDQSDGDQSDGDQSDGTGTDGGTTAGTDSGPSQPSLGTSFDPNRNPLAMNTLGATPAPVTPYEMPFPCGETWTGSTRPNHTPSPRAIDWNAPNDLGMPVAAAAAGTVTTAVVGQRLASYGQYVVIDHGNGESSLYGHLNSVTVTVGQVVTAGQQIGTLGSTGNSTGPHLHFEERLNAVDQDVWLHGSLYPIGTAAISANCGTTTTTTTTPTTPISTHLVPLAGDMYGSAAAEVMLYHKRASSWFEVTRDGKPSKKLVVGTSGDQPVLGDWDGNGKVNVAVRRPSTRSFYLRVRGKDQTIRFGQAKDLPIAGNWDGVGGWEIGVRKAGSGAFKLRAADGSVAKIVLGDANDIPLTGDWDGDGRTDIGVYDSATSIFTLEWTDTAGATYQKQVAFGQPGDYPVAGDWDGDGITDVGVYNPSTRAFERSGQPTTTAARAVRGRVNLRNAYAGVLAPRLGRALPTQP